MSSKVYKVAFVPLDAFGHVNACLGLARNVRERGHKCVFVCNQNWEQLIKKHDFEYHVYIEEHKLQDDSSWNDFMVKAGQNMAKNSFEKLRVFNEDAFNFATNDIKLFNEKLKTTLKDIKPDAIVVDSFVSVPAVMTAGVPWIDLCSCNPLCYFDDEKLPPGESGYPTNDKTLWKAYRNELIEVYSDLWNSFNTWMQSEGAPPLKAKTNFLSRSPYLNFYLYPQELSYEEMSVPKDSKNFLIDALIRTESDSKKFEIPEKLKDRQGKLVYLSMGTLSCSDLNLMRRLISILSKSKQSFIVSKGPLGDQLELADNMWGQNSVPQLQVLPLVDLVLTHGGNNTVTESLYHGTPMIVLPVFGDQYDNAQRVAEKGLGIRLDPYNCSDTQLLDAIEKMVNDSQLKAKYEKISQRIQRSNSRETAAKIVEQVITDFKNNNIKSN